MRFWSPLSIGKQGWQIGIAITWVSRVNSSVKNLLKLAVKLNSEIEAISRLFEIVDNKMLETRKAKKLEYDKTKFENVIIAKNVEYSIGRTKIIRGVNLKVKFGDKVALIGQEGSGRKTLVDMLLGMKKPNEREESSIFLFGKYINDLNPVDYRTKMQYLKRDANLFSGTLRENVDPRHKYSDEEIIKLLHFLKFLDIFKRDTGKYDNRELANYMSNLKFQKGMLSNAILKKSMKKRNDGMSTLIKTNFGKGVNSSKTKSIYKKWKDYYDDKSKRFGSSQKKVDLNSLVKQMKN
jgi:ABC-type transport system involved in cytochrome bd biosynthesis fused ATPase/permease subunit